MINGAKQSKLKFCFRQEWQTQILIFLVGQQVVVLPDWGRPLPSQFFFLT
jgi:hypothetical protein